jgi:Phage derived protein Gp49-like (DUF891)
LNERGDNEFLLWLQSLPKAARIKIDNRILILRAIEVWPAQYVSALKGYEGIFELRIVFSGNQYRPLGCYGPGRGEFTFLLGTIEKGKLPKRVLEIAEQRRKIILLDRSRTCEHQFDEETTD